MKAIRTIIFLLSLLPILLISACKKEFLDAKPSASLVVPSTLADFQAILDNVTYMNGETPNTYGSVGVNGGPTPMLLEVATDNYYITNDTFDILDEQYYKNVYLWDKADAYGGIATVPDWSSPYRAVFYSNVVLDGLKKIPQTAANQPDWNRIKGSALFFRAWAFYHLAQAFAPVYDKSKAKDLLGIPLRLTADINEKSVRSTLEETYNQIFNDLNEAATLVPSVSLYKTRPSVAAVDGLLARAYLSIEDYSNAKIFAQKCLDSNNKPLINYNSVSATPDYPFAKLNDEVIFSSLINSFPNAYLFYPGYAIIDSNLYASYKNNDLRKNLFFTLYDTNMYAFRGGYDGTGYLFCGIATDEIYLILAESLVRLNDVPNGIKYLNELMNNRYTSTFTPYTTNQQEEALSIVLTERRKELLMRGLRLSDLRRLNRDPKFAVTLYRKIHGQTYELPPNDSRYTWPIPNDVIALTGMQQNLR